LLVFALILNAAAQEGEKASAIAAEQVSLAPILSPVKATVVNRASGATVASIFLSAALFGKNGGAAANLDLDQINGTVFQQILSDSSLDFSAEVTAALQNSFKETAHPLAPLLEAKYDPKEPRELDYKATKSSSDLILVTNIREISLLSTTFSTQYVPRLIISFELVSKTTEDSSYSESIQYGGGEKKLTETEIPSDSKYAWNDFNEVMSNRDQVVESFRQGIQQIARQAAQQMQKYIK
jgi:hypothetical protein